MYIYVTKTNTKNNTARPNAVKQLEARIDRLTNAIANRLPGRNAQRRVMKRTVRQNRGSTTAAGITKTDIPVNAAFTVKQITKNPVVRNSAREIIGTMTVFPDTPVGTGTKMMMNPLLMSGTRLQSLAKNFQKYRFTRLALTIQSAQATSVSGLYCAGYNSNPDADYSRSQAVNFITNLPGAVTTNMWVTTTVHGTIVDPNKWYNLDADSDEIMQTTQGYFAASILQPPANSTGAVSFPIWLDYTIELKGNSENPVSVAPPLLAPAGTFTWASGTWTFAVDPDESVTLPLLQTSMFYTIYPNYLLAEDDDITAVAQVLYVQSGTGGVGTTFQFARSLDDAATNNFINGASLSPVQVLRAQWTLN